MATTEHGQVLPEMPSQPPKNEEEPTVSSGRDKSPAIEIASGTAEEKKRGWRPWRKPEPNPAAEPAISGSGPNDVQPTPRRGRRWVLVSAVVVVLLGGAVYVGTILPDPRNSQEYKSLQADGVRLTGELNKAKTDYKTLEDGMKARETRVTAFGQELTKREEAVKTAEAAVKTREEAVTGAEKQKAANTVREGTWTVGVDIEPGTYRTDTEVSSSCYWGIYRTGSNGADIIDNDIVSGGRPTVTLSAGQDFKTTRCGAWTKQ